MRQLILSSAVFSLVLLSEFCLAQQGSVPALQAEIIKMETAFADAVKAQDSAKASQLQSESFFLAIGVQQIPIQIITKSQWLSALKYYVTESYKIGDIKVNIHGNTAVVLMLFTQKATVRGLDRSAQFVITDIWNKGDSGWKISERHSSRPEQRAASQPK